MDFFVVSKDLVRFFVNNYHELLNSNAHCYAATYLMTNICLLRQKTQFDSFLMYVDLVLLLVSISDYHICLELYLSRPHDSIIVTCLLI